MTYLDAVEVARRARKGSGRRRQHLIQVRANDAELGLLVRLARENDWSRQQTVRYALEALEAALQDG